MVIRDPFSFSDRSTIWKYAVIGLCKFRLVLAEAYGRRRRDESPRESALEATKTNAQFYFNVTFSFQKPP